MHQTSVTPNDHEDTDALFDTSPRAMAERFGARVRQNLRTGDTVRQAARLAASFAFRADPALRLDVDASPLTEHLFRLAHDLNVAVAPTRMH